jgi:hypothetical protein
MLVTNVGPAKAYAIMPFIWSVGTILGPSIGGLFAEPVANYPDIFHPGGIFDKFPYLLPNLICSALMLASILAGYFFLVETHPDMQPWSTAEDLQVTTAETPLMPAQAGITTSGANLTHDSYGTFTDVDEEAVEEWDLKADGTSRPTSTHSDNDEKTFTKRVVMLVVALGIFTYHSMTYDSLMPIFFQDERIPGHGRIVNLLSRIPASQHGSLAGGLGLSVKDTGVIMSLNGLIALSVQAFVFPLMASWLGVWNTFIFTAVGHPLAYFIVPWLALVPERLVYPGIYTCLAIRNLFSILAYPCLLILIKEASPRPKALGKINGLAASTGAACRTLASPLAGFLYSLGIKIELTAIAWWASALVAFAGTVQAFFINRRKSRESHRIVAAPCRFMPQEQHRDHRPSIVRIRIQSDANHSIADERTPFASRVYRG